jgi:hypothetical protein
MSGAPVLMTIVPRLPDADAAREVERRFVQGQTLCDKSSGNLYLLGARERNKFWLMTLDQAYDAKILMEPRVILGFEPFDGPRAA